MAYTLLAGMARLGYNNHFDYMVSVKYEQVSKCRMDNVVDVDSCSRRSSQSNHPL